MIGILVPCLGLGGAERQISLIAPRLKAAGLDVVVISMIQPLAFEDVLKQGNVELINLGMDKGKYSLQALFALIKLIRKKKIDKLVTFNYPANFSGRILKMLFPKIQVYTSIRNTTFGSPLREKIMKLTKSFDYKTIPNSSNAADQFMSRGVINPQSLNVINNGILVQDEQYIQAVVKPKAAAIRKEILGTEQKFLWISVGRFEVNKDYETLINACSQLMAKGQSDWVLIILGDGPLRHEMEQQISTLKLGNHIRLLGKQTEVINYYHAADAFVSSSAWEGMPNVLTEAMLFNLPAVATNVGEVSKIMNEERGIMVNAKNAAALSEAMMQLMNKDSKTLAEMGNNASRFIKANFNIDTIIKKWIEILN